MPNLKIFGDDASFPGLLQDPEDARHNPAEVEKAARYAELQPDVGEFQRLAPMVGSAVGAMFCNLDFLKPGFALRTIHVEIYRGIVTGISVEYWNGLAASMGEPGKGHKASMTLDGGEGEKIIFCSIETGSIEGDESKTKYVTTLCLYTNRGRVLSGRSEGWESAKHGAARRDGRPFVGLSVTPFDPLLNGGSVGGFWGYGVSSKASGEVHGMSRLAPLWGSK